MSTTLDRLKEIEQEKKELEAKLLKEKKDVEFPIYVKHRRINFFSRIDEASKCLIVQNYEKEPSICYQDFSSTGIQPYPLTAYLTNEFYQVTPEEFEAARTEAINKLSNL